MPGREKWASVGRLILIFLYASFYFVQPANAAQAIYYIDTTACTPWGNPGCSSADERGSASVSTLTCSYTDTLPAGAVVSNVQVDSYVKYLCSPTSLTYRWTGATLGTYSTLNCACSAGTLTTYSKINPIYTVGGTNSVFVDNNAAQWGGIMGGTAVGWSAGKIMKVTVTYSASDALFFGSD